MCAQLMLLLAALMCGLLHVQMLPVDQAEDSETSHALYDQRQTGKYNIHVSIKDVAIIEVDQNELADESYNEDDDDYYYDDSALTIKPIKFTTEPSTTTTAATTEAPSGTTATSPPSTTTTTTTTTTTAGTTRAATTTTPPADSSAATVAAGGGVAAAAAAAAAAIPTPSSNMSAYSAQLLADIAASQRMRPKANNLIIMDTPISGSSTLLPKWLQARSKEQPLTTTTITKTAALPHIEYTPAHDQDSPIFKVKVQRAATTESSGTRCRAHQVRDAQGKCRSKRSGSILRKLFSMLVSLPFAGHRHAHGHGLQISP